MKYIVVDDEPLARKRIIRLLDKIPEWVNVAEFSSGKAFIESEKCIDTDVVFLDIEMPELNGIEVAKHLNKHYDSPPKIVYVTAYTEFALDAFDVFACAYLVKPIDENSLHKVVNRLKDARIRYQVGNEFRTVLLNDIIIARAKDKYTELVFNGKEAYVDTSLKRLADLYPQHFIQVHRGTLVKKSSIERFQITEQGHFIYLVGYAEAIAVSRRIANEIKSLL